MFYVKVQQHDNLRKTTWWWERFLFYEPSAQLVTEVSVLTHGMHMVCDWAPKGTLAESAGNSEASLAEKKEESPV